MSDLAAITDYLKNKYQPQAIILHGSRARGDAVAGSDYDLTLLMDGDIDGELYQGRRLDLSAEPADCPVLYAARNVPIWPLQILYDDKHGYGAALLTRTRAAFDAGPEKLPAQEWENRRAYIARLLTRLEARQQDTLLANLYMGDLLERAVRYWCEKQGRWTQSPHRLLAVIKAEDPLFYVQLEGLFGKDRLSHAKAIEELLFGDSRN